MAKPKNLIGVTGVILTAVSALDKAAPILNKIADPMVDAVKKKVEKPAIEKTIVPELYKKGFPKTLEQAEETLHNAGFKTIKSELRISDAKPKYRNCIDTQVIASSPKQGSKEIVGTTIHLIYITKEVIEESAKLYEEDERIKAEKKEQKEAAKLEKREQTKEIISNVAKIVKRNNNQTDSDEEVK